MVGSAFSTLPGRPPFFSECSLQCGLSGDGPLHLDLSHFFEEISPTSPQAQTMYHFCKENTRAHEAIRSFGHPYCYRDGSKIIQEGLVHF